MRFGGDCVIFVVFVNFVCFNGSVVFFLCALWFCCGFCDFFYRVGVALLLLVWICFVVCVCGVCAFSVCVCVVDCGGPVWDCL